MEVANESRLQLAINAASQVAATQGLRFEQALVLRNRSNAIMRLYPTDVVARVSTTTGTIRQGDGWFTREVAVAHHLAAAGAPIVPPSSEIDPGPHRHLGLVLSFWKFVQILDEPFDPNTAGQLLRVCHEVLKTFPGELPILALIVEARQILARLIAESVFAPADAEMLLQVGERSQVQLSQLRLQPLHGDSHSGNVLNTTKGVLWTDWEDTFLGPIEWDLASLVASCYVFGTDLEKAEAALQGYGGETDTEALKCCIEARTFVALVWSIVLHQQYASAERQARIEKQLSWFRQREGIE